jgi:hypothetical protein
MASHAHTLLPPCLHRYIRYIYNRIILENATVRAAAVSALANFGARCEGVRERVVVLLKRALYDNDDEVRWHQGWQAWQLGAPAPGMRYRREVCCGLHFYAMVHTERHLTVGVHCRVRSQQVPSNVLVIPAEYGM